MRLRWLVVGLIVLTAAGCGLVVSGAVGEEPVGDGGVDGAIDGSSADANGLDGGGLADATIDVEDDGAEPSLPSPTPGTVMCGANTCTAQTSFCCVGKGQCDGNPNSCGTRREVYCDEPADCPGQLCCLGRNSAEAENASLRCAADCSSASIDGVRVCRTSADCNPAAKCIARTCLGFTVGTCGGALPKQCADGGL